MIKLDIGLLSTVLLRLPCFIAMRNVINIISPFSVYVLSNRNRLLEIRVPCYTLLFRDIVNGFFFCSLEFLLNLVMFMNIQNNLKNSFKSLLIIGHLWSMPSAKIRSTYEFNCQVLNS